MAASEQEMLKAGAKEVKNPSPEQIQEAYQGMEKGIGDMINKIAELDQERREHELVLQALDKVPEGRRCYRMVGGILAERTVKEVRPQVVENKKKLEMVMTNYQQELEKRTKVRKQFVEKYGLNKQQGAQRAAAAAQIQPAQKEGGSGGVLV